jgi:hypothetical protein
MATKELVEPRAAALAPRGRARPARPRSPRAAAPRPAPRRLAPRRGEVTARPCAAKLALVPRPRKTNPLRRLPALALAALTAIAGAACVSKPTMQLDHAEITGIRIAFPPSLGILMTIVVNVHNPNSYDVAVRAVRGQVVLAGRYPLAVDFRADGDGVWLPSDRTTQVRVPVSVPVDLGFQLLRESFSSPVIPYRFSGRADVTATRTFRLEADDYAVDDHGVVARNQIEAALGVMR